MSLSNLLLGGSFKKTAKPVIDSDLDALFRSTATVSINAIPSASEPKGGKKRKSREIPSGVDVNQGEVEEEGRSRKTKKAKSEARLTNEKKGKKKAKVTEVETPSSDAEDPPVVVKKAEKTRKRKQKNIEEAKAESSSEDEENNDDLETVYAAKSKPKSKVKPIPVAASAGSHSDSNTDASGDGDEVDSDEDEEADVDPATLVHESVSKARRVREKSTKVKAKYVPDGETPEQKDARTIFIGNLSAEIAQKRPLLKQLQRHILSHLPSAKIESSRLRSIAFQKPTSKLPTSGDEEASTSKAAPAPTQRQHDRDRMAAWREAEKNREKDEQEIAGDEKKFLTPSQKKKIAFINGELHSSADSVNAYIVFAFPAQEITPRPANLPPLPEVMDPYEAAKAAVKTCDGTTFRGRAICVDLANKAAAVERVGPANGNPKLSIFVGNLDFGCKEEDLRVFFEGVISAERGPPPAGKGSDDEGEGRKANAWVTRVRIVRDKETQLGKGFAYVQFADRECVDEILSMEETKLKFAKRKLRVQRCKTISGTAAKTKIDVKTPKVRALATPIAIPSVPKGNPALGDKLAHLTKDERKQFKSSDADRVARRLAKKKARSALEKQGVRAQVKDRDRTRKTAAEKHAKAPKKKEVSKGRIRSEKSVAKRNTKK